MKGLKIVIFSAILFLLSACSFGYEIVIVNESNEMIEIRYKVGENQPFDEPFVKSVEDWKTQRSTKRFWTEEKPWQKLAENEYETDLQTRERTVRVAAGQIIKIEYGHYNPLPEKSGELTRITEFKIKSLSGEIVYRGKLLLGEFVKEDFTFIKTYKGITKESNSK